MRPDGVLCRCGRHGCLETVASTRAILAALADRGITRLPEAIAALEAGDAGVRDVVVAAGRELGIAVAWLVGALNIERVVLVGSAAEFGEPWLDAVRDTMRRSALGILASQTSVEIGRLHDDGVVLGASALLMTRELGLSLAGLPPEVEAGGGDGTDFVAGTDVLRPLAASG